MGLGNPGDKYVRTRHNIGARLAARLAGPDVVWQNFHGVGLWVKADPSLVAVPLTFMNESGRFVQSFSSYYKIPPSDILICYDEIALPLGRLRLRRAGSAGGQKGMKSVIDCLGTQEIPRLRIGIGPQPEFMDSADFVLQKFTAAEEPALDAALSLAEQAVGVAVCDGVEAAMNRFNPAESA